MLLKFSTARSRVVLMIDSTDHIAGKTGLSLTITASKDGGSFASITPTVTELSNGWYKLALTAPHTDTLGDLALHITATGADPTDIADQVVNSLPGDPFATSQLTAIADVILDRDLSAGFDTVSRSVRNALRLLRNKWTLTGATLSVKKEDDTAEAWNATVTTDAAALPITGNDPS